MMSISGLIQTPSYDAGAASAAAMTRAIMAPNYITNAPYTGASTSGMVAQQQQHQQHQQHNPFSGAQYGAQGSNSVVPHFPNYVQRRPQYQNDVHATDNLTRAVSYSRPIQQGYVEEHHSPIIKPEPRTLANNGASWNVNNAAMAAYPTAPPTVIGAADVNFGTDVDTLMKAIQAKATQPSGQHAIKPQPTSPSKKSRSVVGSSASPQAASFHHEHAPNFPLTSDEEKQRLTCQDNQDGKELLPEDTP